MKKTGLIIIPILGLASVLGMTACGTGNTQQAAQPESVISESVAVEIEEAETVAEEEIAEEELAVSEPEVEKTDTMYAVKLDGTMYHYEYSGDKIVGIKAYIDLGSEKAAEDAVNVYKENGIDEGIKDVYAEGTSMVLESDESEYSKITVNELEELYNMFPKK